MTPTFNAIGLTVADMAAALDFYRGLGLDISPEMDKEPHAEVTLAGGLRLMWDTHDTIKSFDPDFVPVERGSWGGLAFQCADPAEVDSAYARMTGAGHTGHKEPWDAFWGQRYAVLHDPDGNSVELYAALPTNQ
jgi:catechol 2,3-dioxygenase-like lactoylglutathione lyase family enzyme